MLIVLSPAKALDFTPVDGATATTPELADQTAILSRHTRALSVRDLKRLMDLSDGLAKLNRERFQAFDPKSTEGLAAAFAFNGDVYQGLRARDLGADDLAWAQDHVRILSGLYGLLRPLDAIQPYRLEMHSRLKTRRGETLYDFWAPLIAKALNRAAEGHADRTLVNCASSEYFGAVDRKALKLPVLTIRFLEEKDGERKIVSFMAKRARGLMARYMVENRIEKADDLRGFTLGGYAFEPGLSKDLEWSFARPYPNLAAAA